MKNLKNEVRKLSKINLRKNKKNMTKIFLLFTLITLTSIILSSAVSASDPITANPQPGTYYTPQLVELSGPTNSRIHYTTDGSDPYLNGDWYTGPIYITQNTTIKYYLHNEMTGTVSPPYSLTYHIITLILTLPPGNPANNSTNTSTITPGKGAQNGPGNPANNSTNTGTIPMLPTGGPLIPLIMGILSIAAGISVASKLK
jgi:hypothetical protein